MKIEEYCVKSTSNFRQKYDLIARCYDKKGNLISEATNSYKKTHPIQAYFAQKVGLPMKVFLHAEIAAILKAGKRKIYRIEVERYGKKGQPLNARPCPICEEAIKAFGIQKVSFTVG